VLRLATTDEQRSKVVRILQFSFPDEDRNVPDPYLDKIEGFEHVFALLDAACESFLDHTTT